MFNIFVQYGDNEPSIILDYDKRGRPRACLWTTRHAAKMYVDEAIKNGIWFSRGTKAPTFIIREAPTEVKEQA